MIKRLILAGLGRDTAEEVVRLARVMASHGYGLMEAADALTKALQVPGERMKELEQYISSLYGDWDKPPESRRPSVPSRAACRAVRHKCRAGHRQRTKEVLRIP